MNEQYRNKLPGSIAENLADALSFPCALLNLDSKFTWFNEEFKKRFGQVKDLTEFLNLLKISPEEYNQDEQAELSSDYGMLIKKPIEDENGNIFYSICLDIYSAEQEKRLKEIVHDFNNILSNIYQSAGIINESLDNPEQISTLLERIRINVKRASGLVKNILQRDTEPETAPNQIIDLKDILNDVASDSKLKFPKINITSNIDQNLDKIFGKKESLFRIFNNLVSNAAEAVDDGGEIEISADNYHIEKEGVAENLTKGKYVRIKVADNGEGISREKLGRIFERGFSTKDRDKESGLGLYIVKKEIEAMNGVIEVDSKLNNGTEFTLYFKSAKRLQKKTVLIADDEKDLRELIADLFKSYNYEVLEASENKIAIEKIESGIDVDLMIIDQKMPDMKGLQCIREIRKINSQIPLVLISGSEHLREEDAKKAGADRFLLKPFTFDQLLEISTELLY
jgi:signal transduction histidine kinase